MIFEISQRERTAKAIEKYKHTVYGIAVSQLAYKCDADDVFQEVFLLYYSKNITFEDEEHEKAWLIRTAINFCRRMNGSPWRTRMLPYEQNEEERFACELPEQTAVVNEVRALKPRYSLPVYLYYFENMPAAKIAEILKISEAAVRKRLSRAREMLKKRLEGDYLE